jgi:hypothetical protein
VYVLAWLVIGTAAALGAVTLLKDRKDLPALPPVRQTELTAAAAAAGCRLMHVRTTGNPPAAGASDASPARPGTYTSPLRAEAIVAALRRGIVVVHYLPGVSDGLLRKLEAIQASVPRGTILAPSETTMPYELASTAYHRLLGCPRLTAAALDAVRLFRGRYLGSGPD